MLWLVACTSSFPGTGAEVQAKSGTAPEVEWTVGAVDIDYPVDVAATGHDPDGDSLTFRWVVWDEPYNSHLVTEDLQGRTDATMTFVPDVEGTYEFRLRVSDGTNTVEVYPKVRVAESSAPEVLPQVLNVPLGEVALLSAGESWDRNGPVESIQWSFVPLVGPDPNSALTDADLHDADQWDAWFEPDVEGRFLVALTMTDQTGNVVTAVRKVQVGGELGADRGTRHVHEDPDQSVGRPRFLPDLDGDGEPELSWLVSTNGTLRDSALVIDVDPPLVLEQQEPLQQLTGVNAAGDLNGDGQLDLVVNNPSRDLHSGAVYLLNGPLGEPTLDDADAVIYGTSSYDYVGNTAMAGDVDGDGNDDLFISDDDDMVLALGPLSGQHPIGDVAQLVVEDAAFRYGAGLFAHDLDGDGVPDLAANDSSDQVYGYVVFGMPTTGSVSVDDADRVYEGFPAVIHDVDDDGYPDLLNSQYFPGNGQVTVHLGPDVPEQPDATLYGTSWEGRFGLSAHIADIDDDSHDELLVHSWGTMQTGEVRIWESIPTAGWVPDTSADTRVLGTPDQPLERELHATHGGWLVYGDHDFWVFD